MGRRIASLTMMICFLTIAGCRLQRQGFEAQLTGTVKDQSGAVIPNAKLLATNLRTKVNYSATSNEEGIYRLASLPPAEYKVTCSAAGFKRFQQDAVTLQVAQVLALNVELQAGDVSQEITVSAGPPPLETETATVGQVVTTRSIIGLPLNVRDPLALKSHNGLAKDRPHLA